MKNPTVKTRRYLYRLGLSVVLVLFGYGLLSEDQAVLWVGVLAPLLGLADVNATE